ncbi:short-chain dehydrogenase/reductase SDR [Hyaloraphidium curvatum]|nr:short-chain dehydrogenase/reductase SDR [Hyaloraphidium curvatum]
METIEREFGRLDVQVNNAGVFFDEGFIPEEELSAFEAVQKVNLSGVFLGTRHAIPLMLRSTSAEYRSVVNMCSDGGIIGTPDPITSYIASKFGVRGLTKFGPDTGAAPDLAGLIASTVPLGRHGEPEDVAEAVVFLASDESSFITGSELVIDGGYTAQEVNAQSHKKVLIAWCLL